LNSAIDDNGGWVTEWRSNIMPNWLPTKITHEPQQADIYIYEYDITAKNWKWIKVAWTTSDIRSLGGASGVIAKAKEIAKEVYKAKSRKLLEVFLELNSIELDLKCYINDPASSTY
jgi:hypothetical protein